MTVVVFALGAAVLFQFIILRIKWNKGRYADTFVDIAMLIILNGVFAGSILGVLSVTAGSTLISLYLLWKPIKLLSSDAEESLKDTVSKGKSRKSFKDLADKLDEIIEGRN